MRLIFRVVALFLSLAAWAEEMKNPLEIQLISEAQAIAPGQPFMLGFHLKHPEKHHSYWKHPGIVGYATEVKWELPSGFLTGEIEWPAPKLVKMSQYTAQGYHGETLLMIRITPPAKIDATKVKLAAKVSWMCCADRCHPASAVPFSIELPVAATMQMNETTRPLFEKFRARLPKIDASWQATAKREKDHFLLKLKPPSNKNIHHPEAIRFFTTDGQVDSDRPQQVSISNEEILMKLPLSEMAPKNVTKLPGVIHLPAGWQEGEGEFYLEIGAE